MQVERVQSLCGGCLILNTFRFLCLFTCQISAHFNQVIQRCSLQAFRDQLLNIFLHSKCCPDHFCQDRRANISLLPSLPRLHPDAEPDEQTVTQLLLKLRASPPSSIFFFFSQIHLKLINLLPTVKTPGVSSPHIFGLHSKGSRGMKRKPKRLAHTYSQINKTLDRESLLKLRYSPVYMQ